MLRIAPALPAAAARPVIKAADKIERLEHDLFIERVKHAETFECLVEAHEAIGEQVESAERYETALREILAVSEPTPSHALLKIGPIAKAALGKANA